MVPLDRVGVVLDCRVKLAVFNIDGFHTIAVLLFLKLVVHDSLEADLVVVEQAEETVQVALVAHDVVAVA